MSEGILSTKEKALSTCLRCNFQHSRKRENRCSQLSQGSENILSALQGSALMISWQLPRNFRKMLHGNESLLKRAKFKANSKAMSKAKSKAWSKLNWATLSRTTTQRKNPLQRSKSGLQRHFWVLWTLSMNSSSKTNTFWNNLSRRTTTFSLWGNWGIKVWMKSRETSSIRSKMISTISCPKRSWRGTRMIISRIPSR